MLLCWVTSGKLLNLSEPSLHISKIGITSHSYLIGVFLFVCLKYLFVYLVVPGLNCGMHVGSSSLTRDQTQAPCTGIAESYPPRHQGSPIVGVLTRVNGVRHVKCLALSLAHNKGLILKKGKRKDRETLWGPILFLHPQASSKSLQPSTTRATWSQKWLGSDLSSSIY